MTRSIQSDLLPENNRLNMYETVSRNISIPLRKCGKLSEQTWRIRPSPWNFPLAYFCFRTVSRRTCTELNYSEISEQLQCDCVWTGALFAAVTRYYLTWSLGLRKKIARCKNLIKIRNLTSEMPGKYESFGGGKKSWKDVVHILSRAEDTDLF